jgi:hypothetical protein
MSENINRKDVSSYKISQMSMAQLSNGHTTNQSNDETPPNMFQRKEKS